MEFLCVCVFDWCLISLLILDPVQNYCATQQGLEVKNLHVPVMQKNLQVTVKKVFIEFVVGRLLLSSSFATVMRGSFLK